MADYFLGKWAGQKKLFRYPEYLVKKLVSLKGTFGLLMMSANLCPSRNFGELEDTIRQFLFDLVWLLKKLNWENFPLLRF